MSEFNAYRLGERIKALRLEKGIGQNRLAEEVCVSNASVSYWETGKQIPSAEVIFKLACYFDVSADYLLGIDD